MTYTIGEAAKKLELTVPTLRYYDREGLLPYIQRTKSGNRIFKNKDLELLNVIKCLKSSGMSINAIKMFIEWCDEGDATLHQRFDMFTEQKAAVEKQMKELESTLSLINHKCEYYETALAAGSESIHKENKIGNTVFSS